MRQLIAVHEGPAIALAAQNFTASRLAKRRAQALTSYAHHRAGVDFHDPNFHYRACDPWIAYGQSKTANSLFAVALHPIGGAEASAPSRCIRQAL